MSYNCKTILVLANDPEIMGSVSAMAWRYNAEVYSGETAIDLIAIPADLQIVDRTCTKRKDWEAYLDYLSQLGAPMGMQAYIDCPELLEVPTEDKTPIIIVDNLPTIVADLSYPEPVKPASSMHFISYSSVDDIKERIARILGA